MNDLKGAALIVIAEVFYILQDKSGWLVKIQNFSDGKKEVALFFIIKAVFPAQAVFFRDACETKRLTWKSRTKDVKLRNISYGHRMNVTMWEFAEVGCISLLGKFIPVA